MPQDPDYQVNLNNISGAIFGTDATRFSHLVSFIKANLRLGNAMTIEIDESGSAQCWNHGDEEDN